MTMLDPGATSKGPMSDTLPEKDENGGYASGGWKSEDGRLSCGYSSFRGKRAKMEDFYDIKTSKINGQPVCLFGIFDAIPLSEDHKPNRSDERKRIESAGGVVMWAGTWRVGGVLAMSRAFGNRMLKQFVVAEPEIQEQEVDQDLELLVLASDGLWDVVPNEDAVLIAQTEEEPEAAARKLTETAFSRGSADNITCIVVKFNHERGEPEQTQLHLRLSAEPRKLSKVANQMLRNPSRKP
ncbi:UNVERIFIED_CONTAM: putative protein phosphatase 2C 76 [Sesamum radiatum]|uniref:PPM-type phosphatase domain-containing protein n=1 Tax=Sesamum radiatum TaxID=300843 RepID=A0AAW2KEZ2_SESRA